ncbi:MAG: hypothetical protein WCR42_12420 [bacterium]
MKKTFLILILIFVFGSISKTAANDIFIADTTLSRQYSALIRLEGSLDLPADSVKIVLKYNPYQLNIIDVFSNENNIFMEPALYFSKNYISFDSYELAITSRKINPNGKYFCNIKLQALINKDSIFKFEPLDLTINGIPTTANFKAGNFLVKNPIQETQKAEIGYAYPNPFYYETKLEFYLPNDADVGIKIYNTFGQMLKTVEKDYESPEFIFLDSSNQIFRFNPTEKLAKGRYYMNWQPKLEIWASTAYYIVFNIGGEIYQTNVIMVR